MADPIDALLDETLAAIRLPTRGMQNPQDVPMAQQQIQMRPPGMSSALMDPTPIARQRPLPEPYQAPGFVEGMADAVTDGYMGGLGAKMTAAEAAVLGRTPEGGMFNYDRPFGERYDRALHAERGQNAAFQRDHGIASAAGEIGGLVASFARGPLGAAAGAMTNRLPQAATRLGRVRRAGTAGAIEGGLVGATQAFGDGENVLSGAAMDATLGAGIGAGFRAAGEVGQSMLRRGQVGRAARTAADERAVVQAAGDEFRGENVAVSKDVVRRIMAGAEQQLAEEGVDRAMAPEAFRAFEQMRRIAEDENLSGVSMRYLANLRRRVSQRAGTAQDGVERHASGTMLRVFDDVFNNLTPTDAVAGGDPQRAVAALREVNSAYQRMLKAQEMDKVIASAPFYAGGGEKGLQSQLRTLGRRAVDPTRQGGAAKLFDDADVRVIEDAMDGTWGEKLLSQAGRMSGFSGPGAGSNALGAAMGIGGGASIGGMIGEALMPGTVGAMAGALGGAATASGIGTAARSAAERNAFARARLAQALISGTQNLPPPSMTQRALTDDQAQALLRQVLLGTAVGATN